MEYPNCLMLSLGLRIVVGPEAIEEIRRQSDDVIDEVEPILEVCSQPTRFHLT